MKLLLIFCVLSQTLICSESEKIYGRSSQAVNLVKKADANSQMVCLPYSFKPANTTMKFVKFIVDLDQQSTRMMVTWKNHTEAKSMMDCAKAAAKARTCKDDDLEAEEGEAFPISVKCGDLIIHGQKVCRNGRFVEDIYFSEQIGYVPYYNLNSTTGCIFSIGEAAESQKEHTELCYGYNSIPCAPRGNEQREKFIEELKKLRSNSPKPYLDVGLFSPGLSEKWFWASSDVEQPLTEGWAPNEPNNKEKCTRVGPKGLESRPCEEETESTDVCCMIQINCEDAEHKAQEGQSFNITLKCGDLEMPGRKTCRNGQFVKEQLLNNGWYTVHHNLDSMSGCIFVIGYGLTTKPDQIESCADFDAEPCAPINEGSRKNYIEDLHKLRTAVGVSSLLEVGLFLETKEDQTEEWTWSTGVSQPKTEGMNGWGPDEPLAGPGLVCSVVYATGLLSYSCSTGTAPICCMRKRPCSDGENMGYEGDHFPHNVTCGGHVYEGRKICRKGNFIEERKLPNGMYVVHQDLSSASGCMFSSGPGDSTKEGQMVQCSMNHAVPCAPPLNANRSLFVKDLEGLHKKLVGGFMEIGLFQNKMSNKWEWTNGADQSSEIGTEGWAVGHPRPDPNYVCGFFGRTGIASWFCNDGVTDICCMVMINCKDDEHELMEGESVPMNVSCGNQQFEGRKICKNGKFIQEQKLTMDGEVHYVPHQDLTSSSGCMFSVGEGNSTKSDQEERCGLYQSTPCHVSEMEDKEECLLDMQELRKNSGNEFLDVGLYLEMENQTNVWKWFNGLPQDSMMGSDGWGMGQPGNNPSLNCAKMGSLGLISWPCNMDVTDVCCMKRMPCTDNEGDEPIEGFEGSHFPINVTCGATVHEGRKICRNGKFVTQRKLPNGQYHDHQDLSSTSGCIFSVACEMLTNESQMNKCMQMNATICAPSNDEMRMDYIEDLKALRSMTGSPHLQVGLFLNETEAKWLWNSGVEQPGSNSMEGWAPMEPKMGADYMCGNIGEDGLHAWQCFGQMTNICCMNTS